MYFMKRGRKPNPNKLTEANINSFRDIISEYKMHINDSITDDEFPNPSLIKFTQLPVYKQNIFIIYVDKKLKIKDLASILQVDKNELAKLIREIKKELK